MKKKSPPQSKISLLIIAEILIGISASVLSFFIFLKLAVNIESVHQIDVFISMLVYELRTPLLTTLMFGITALGNELILIFMVAILLISIVRRHKREAVMVVLIFLLGVFLNLLLKEIIGRARPDISPLISEQFYSFPSGHAMNAFVFYTTLILYVYRVSRSVVLTMISALINGSIIVLIGISRIYLGVHYFTDVLAGFVAGFWLISTALAVEKSLRLLWRRRKSAT